MSSQVEQNPVQCRAEYLSKALELFLYLFSLSLFLSCIFSWILCSVSHLHSILSSTCFLFQLAQSLYFTFFFKYVFSPHQKMTMPFFHLLRSKPWHHPSVLLVFLSCLHHAHHALKIYQNLMTSLHPSFSVKFLPQPCSPRANWSACFPCDHPATPTGHYNLRFSSPRE